MKLALQLYLALFYPILIATSSHSKTATWLFVAACFLNTLNLILKIQCNQPNNKSNSGPKAPR